MEPRELELRNATYGLLRELGRAPAAVEVATRLGLAVDDVLEGWRRLDAQHAIVLDGTGAALRMLHPFSAVPTGYRVWAADRWWYANCAWDAFGVCAALAPTGGSRRGVPTATSRSRSRFATVVPTTRLSPSTHSSPRRRGGTTSSSPEARCSSSGRRSTSNGGSRDGSPVRRSRSPRSHTSRAPGGTTGCRRSGVLEHATRVNGSSSGSG